MEQKPKSFIKLAEVMEGYEDDESAEVSGSKSGMKNLHNRQMSVIPEDMDDVLS